jgi:LEA14-like dessication related protein
VLALLFVVLLSACATSDPVVPPQVNLVNIYPGKSLGIFEQQFVVQLRVSNPNNFDIPLDGLSFDMAVNGAHFATGLSNTPVTIPRLSSAIVSVNASASSFDLFRQILNVAESGSVDYKIVGTVLLQSALHGPVPFERTGTLNLRPDARGRDRLAPTDGRRI